MNADLTAHRAGEIPFFLFSFFFHIVLLSLGGLRMYQTLRRNETLKSSYDGKAGDGRHIDTIKTLSRNGPLTLTLSLSLSAVIAPSENSLTFSQMSQIYIILGGPLRRAVFMGN